MGMDWKIGELRSFEENFRRVGSGIVSGVEIFRVELVHLESRNGYLTQLFFGCTHISMNQPPS